MSLLWWLLPLLLHLTTKTGGYESLGLSAYRKLCGVVDKNNKPEMGSYQLCFPSSPPCRAASTTPCKPPAFSSIHYCLAQSLGGVLR